jgi:heparosan-N-sulfate-glucuronate 5-epimerase
MKVVFFCARVGMFLLCFSSISFILGSVFTQNKNEFFKKEPYVYTMDFDRLDVSKWLSSNNRQIDSVGIIKNSLNGMTYHPLGIVHFGMLSFHYFKETNDSVYYHYFMNQVNYFKDSTKVHTSSDGTKIGLPYTFNFKDLKAPWYSGMTQGWAIVFLLRYYHHTRDESILPIIQKIAKFMLEPLNKNGAMGYTPEGRLWIEEYPNSKQKPQVLNGYINGLLGLKEYTDLFTEDTVAKKMHNETYQSLLKSLTLYDTPTWSNYDRKNNALNNQYLQYQIFEMQDLYHIYGEKQFLDQMKIWCYMGYKKYITESHLQFKLKNFDLSEKAIPHGKGYYSRFVRKNLLTSKNSQLISLIENKVAYEVMPLSKKTTITLDVTQSANKSIKGFIVFDSTYSGKKVTFLLRDTVTRQEDKVVSKVVKIGGNRMFAFAYNGTISVNQLMCEYSTTSTRLVRIVDVGVQHNYRYHLPFYTFVNPLVEELTNGKYSLKVGQKVNAEDYTIFYRWSDKKEMLLKEKWQTSQQLNSSDAYITLERSGFYEFLIIYKPTHEHSYIEGFKLTKIE